MANATVDYRKEAIALYECRLSIREIHRRMPKNIKGRPVVGTTTIHRWIQEYKTNNQNFAA